MAFYDTADFIEAFRNGGCFIFEGEDDNKEPSKETDEVTERESGNNTPAEPAENTDESPAEDTPAEEAPVEEEPTEQTTADAPAAEPGDVNADGSVKGKESYTADQIVKEFKSSGAEKAVLQYACSKLQGGKVSLQEGAGGKPTITLRMLLPYIKAGIEKFCQKQTFTTSVAEMAKAVMRELKSLSAEEVQKQKAKAAQAQKQAARQQEKKEQQQEGGNANAEAAPPADDDAGGGKAPTAPDEGSEEEVAPPAE
jgi:hypothetical protein